MKPIEIPKNLNLFKENFEENTRGDKDNDTRLFDCFSINSRIEFT